MFKPEKITSSTGAILNLYVARTKREAKGIVQISHGMAEHGARYERFCTFLNEHGYHAYVHDQRGHGHTKIADAPLGAFARHDGWQKVLEDVNFVNAHIRRQHEGLPVICFGHSMGATIALAYAQSYPDTIDGLAVWNGSETGFMPGFLRQLLKVERMFKGSDVPSIVAQKLTFEDWNKKFKPNRTDFDWLSHDETEVDKYVADPLCGFPVTVGLWIDLLDGLAGTAAPEAVAKIPADLPINLRGGGDDPCSSMGKAATNLEVILQNSGHTNINAKIYSNTRHECLNEINRDEVMKDFTNWLYENFG
ncbi:MAG: alpha/beta hydrolase [Rhizobiaceae bacterium]